jgi:hypothetical protein
MGIKLVQLLSVWNLHHGEVTEKKALKKRYSQKSEQK